MPQDITSNLMHDDSTGGCVIQLGWNPLINLALEDISHYIVYVDEIDVLNKISEADQNLTQISYPMCNCGAHNVSVSAVSCCGCEGQRSPSITLGAIILNPGKKCTFNAVYNSMAVLSQAQSS